MIDPALVECIPLASAIRKLTPRRFGTAFRSNIGHRADRWYSAIVAQKLRNLDFSTVVAYENSAKPIFEIARDRGAITVLDAASVHHKLQDKLLARRESESDHAKIIANKDAEIQLADWVITTSDFARESYIKAGVDASRVVTIAMGVDIDLFGQKSIGERNTGQQSEIRFIFVGRFEPLKGSVELTNAMETLQNQNARVSLSIVGDIYDRKILQFKNVRSLGKQTHAELSTTLAVHDVLILPSHFDSFGMVVIEAMAAGLPVIVSPGVGAKMVVNEKRNGIVTKDNSEHSLIEAIKWFSANRASYSAMSQKAKETATSFTWKKYHQRINEFFCITESAR
ncbi:glycosyltransferase family 4 protein [Rosistilla oblonga]|uniref:glycosyltransferase family 4 protein n=1 Tax=Rosistilla oblonga TaxID=2527990 RepID=UPI003A982B9F